jgi:hypothetical protein
MIRRFYGSLGRRNFGGSSYRYHEQGAHLTDNPDTFEKASIGHLWTAKSQYKAVPPGRAAFSRAW